jgi:hypothetical protein
MIMPLSHKLKSHLSVILMSLALNGMGSQALAQMPVNAEAMAKLAPLAGTWRGTAKGVGPDRKPFEVTQTERAGPMLSGNVMVIEGRGYEAGGALAFNAFAVVSYNAQTRAYEFRAYNGPYAGTYPLTLTETGFAWEMPAGPDAKIRYSIDIKDGRWLEVGQYIKTGKPAVTTMTLDLKRVGDTEWPSAGAVTP